MGPVKIEVIHDCYVIGRMDLDGPDDEETITLEIDGVPWVGIIATPGTAEVGQGLDGEEWVRLAKYRPTPTSVEEAEHLGWSIDRHVYPWVAYQGERFAPDRLVKIATPGFDPNRRKGNE